MQNRMRRKLQIEKVTSNETQRANNARFKDSRTFYDSLVFFTCTYSVLFFSLTEMASKKRDSSFASMAV